MQNGESLRRWLGKPVREQRGLERARHDHLQHFVVDRLWYHIDNDRGAPFRRLHVAGNKVRPELSLLEERSDLRWELPPPSAYNIDTLPPAEGWPRR